MEGLFDFVTAFTLFGYWWALLIASAFWLGFLFESERDSNGWIATVATAIFGTLLYFKSNVDVLAIFTITNISIYVGVGFIYSLIKTYFYAKKGGEKYDLKDHVFRWWGLWPISLLFWIFSDLVKDLYNFIYNKVSFIFDSIFEYGAPKKKNKEKDLEN